MLLYTQILLVAELGIWVSSSSSVAPSMLSSSMIASSAKRSEGSEGKTGKKNHLHTILQSLKGIKIFPPFLQTYSIIEDFLAVVKTKSFFKIEEEI